MKEYVENMKKYEGSMKEYIMEKKKEIWRNIVPGLPVEGGGEILHVRVRVPL